MCSQLIPALVVAAASLQHGVGEGKMVNMLCATAITARLIRVALRAEPAERNAAGNILHELVGPFYEMPWA
jgi:hypothetical protein